MDIEGRPRRALRRTSSSTQLGKELEKVEKLFKLHASKMRTGIWFNPCLVPRCLAEGMEEPLSYRREDAQKLSFYLDQLRRYDSLKAQRKLDLSRKIKTIEEVDRWIEDLPQTVVEAVENLVHDFDAHVTRRRREEERANAFKTHLNLIPDYPMLAISPELAARLNQVRSEIKLKDPKQIKLKKKTFAKRIKLLRSCIV